MNSLPPSPSPSPEQAGSQAHTPSEYYTQAQRSSPFDWEAYHIELEELRQRRSPNILDSQSFPPIVDPSDVETRNEGARTMPHDEMRIVRLLLNQLGAALKEQKDRRAQRNKLRKELADSEQQVYESTLEVGRLQTLLKERNCVLDLMSPRPQAHISVIRRGSDAFLHSADTGTVQLKLD